MIAAWNAGLTTKNSCQAWGEWSPELFPPPHPRRIDLTTEHDAQLLAELLRLQNYTIERVGTDWVSLTWLTGHDHG